MRCTYCGSDRVVLRDGEYVYAERGTVLGCEVKPPRWAERALRALERAAKTLLKAKYSLIVKLGTVCRRLGVLDLDAEALSLFHSLPHTAWQGKSPRVVATAAKVSLYSVTTELKKYA